MQRGIASVVILILIAVVIGLTALGLGFYAIQSANPRNDSVPLPPEYLIPPAQIQTSQAATSTQCPDIDHTGCDTSSQWMTWDESDVQVDSSSKSTILVK
jgi:hypothetical protein